MKLDARLLSDGDIERIEAQALKVLEQVGVLVNNDGLCRLAASRGVPVEGRLIRLPGDVVRSAIAAAPRSVVLYGRNGDVLPLACGHCHPATYAEAVNVADYGATSLRSSTLADTVRFVRLGQAMPEVRIVSPVCFACDLPPPVQLLRTAEAVVLNSDKHHTLAPLNVNEARLWYDLIQLAGPGIDIARTPVITCVVSTTSPLQLDHDTAAVLEFAAQKKIPFIAASCPMAGGTSPLALVGTIVQFLAEDLFLLTMAQMVNEAAPVILGGAAGMLDMRTGRLSYGAPERHLLLGATIELADHYGLPHHSPAGSVDAWYPDVHAGAEKMQCWMARRINQIVFGIAFGSLYNGAAVSLEQMLIDADLWREAGRFFQGLDVADLEDSFEVIRRIGPGGNFLTDEQTARLMRTSEVYYSPLANREGDRGPGMLERAHRRVERMLSGPSYHAADAIAEEISRYVSERSAALIGEA